MQEEGASEITRHAAPQRLDLFKPPVGGGGQTPRTIAGMSPILHTTDPGGASVGSQLPSRSNTSSPASSAPTEASMVLMSSWRPPHGRTLRAPADKCSCRHGLRAPSPAQQTELSARQGSGDVRCFRAPPRRASERQKPGLACGPLLLHAARLALRMDAAGWPGPSRGKHARTLRHAAPFGGFLPW